MGFIFLDVSVFCICASKDCITIITAVIIIFLF